MKRSLSMLLLGIALVGAGCAADGPSVLQRGEPSGPKRSSFEGLSPADATVRMNFIPGSSLEMRQTVFGFGARIADALAGNNKEGVRLVVIERFAPRETADVSWRLATKVEGATSKKARAEAAKNNKPVPEPVMVDEVLIGTLVGFNLREASSLYLPAYWPPKERAAAWGTSGIWLPNDAFDGLSRNRVATLNFGILDDVLQGRFATSTEFRPAFSALKSQVQKIESRTDVFLLKGEPDLVEWPLNVNGQDIKVHVIKAKSWFGEIVVLNNPQNPLVLKATLNPLGQALLGSLVGYEITKINDVQE